VEFLYAAVVLDLSSTAAVASPPRSIL